MALPCLALLGLAFAEPRNDRYDRYDRYDRDDRDDRYDAYSNAVPNRTTAGCGGCCPHARN